MALVYGNSILDQRCIFHTLKNVGEKVRGELIGVHAAVYLQVQRLHACWTKANWWDISHALYFSLADLHP